MHACSLASRWPVQGLRLLWSSPRHSASKTPRIESPAGPEAPRHEASSVTSSRAPARVPVAPERRRNRFTLPRATKLLLRRTARSALTKAYTPYSGMAVGAAILTYDDRVFTGANIGNSCSTLNCCAEQVALSAAVMSGAFTFRAIAIAQSADSRCVPCGRCLQLLADFADDLLILGGTPLTPEEWRLTYLLPAPYRRPRA